MAYPGIGLFSEEGTTQGDPLAIPLYALTTLPLIRHLQKEHPSVRQAWLADDSAGAGKLKAIRKRWYTLSEHGQLYRYETNMAKNFSWAELSYLNIAKDVGGPPAKRSSPVGSDSEQERETDPSASLHFVSCANGQHVSFRMRPPWRSG